MLIAVPDIPRENERSNAEDGVLRLELLPSCPETWTPPCVHSASFHTGFWVTFSSFFNFNLKKERKEKKLVYLTGPSLS